ncbi:MAG TPA: family 16 glycosylhydrolase, partial [Anaerolineae bacterium]|nr:family 16 glycosylhydrolase [Anaerolineae bacterium]
VDDVIVYGQTGVEPVIEVTFAASNFAVDEGGTATISVMLNTTETFPVAVSYATAESRAVPYRDYLPTSGTLVFPPGVQVQTFAVATLQDNKYEGTERIALHLSDPVSVTLGFLRRAILSIEDDDVGDPDLLDDFEGAHSYAVTGSVALDLVEVMTGTAQAVPGQGDYEHVLAVDYGDTLRAAGGPSFWRTFVESQDWNSYEGLSFWFYGSNSGDTITVQVYDNQAATTGEVAPDDWVLAWSDEFDDAAGTVPDPSKWSHEIGDGGLNGIPGWGNGELEFYTDSPDNAATDGLGNLVITAQAVDTATTDLLCWYGPCEYTSARLLTADKAEFAYGRIEARLKIPYGQGVWPAWWSLGNDIAAVPWPACGEIDIMENIGSEPATVHGTIHGPGYSGGSGIGGSYTLPTGNLSDAFHTYAVEWTPDQIRWFIDDTNYFTATVGDIPVGTEWVYDHPFFLLLNVAVGGNWPGYPDDTTIFPQTMHIDYVRVYGAADTAERFEASFVDSFSGWTKVTIRFDALTRSAEQPAGAPDDGLGLTEVWGYGFKLPATGSGAFYLDQVSLEAEAQMYHYYLPLIGKQG